MERKGGGLGGGGGGGGGDGGGGGRRRRPYYIGGAGEEEGGGNAVKGREGGAGSGGSGGDRRVGARAQEEEGSSGAEGGEGGAGGGGRCVEPEDRLEPAIPYTKPPPLARIARVYTVLNLNDTRIEIRNRWRQSLLDYRLWCYNNSDMQFEIGHVNRRYCMMPPKGQFFIYMSYKEKWLCAVIDGPSGYLYGYITRSVGKAKKDRRIRQNAKEAQYIQHAEKLPYDGGYESEKVTKCGDLVSSFKTMYSHVGEEENAPSNAEVIRAGETFILHFTEAGKNDKLQQKIFDNFRSAHTAVGDEAIIEGRQWSSSCVVVYRALGIKDEEFGDEPKDIRYNDKRKKMTTEGTAMRAKITLTELRLLHRPDNKPGYLLLRDMPMQLTKDGPKDPIWAEKELRNSLQFDLDNPNWEFLTERIPKFPKSNIDASTGKLVENACMNTGDFMEDKLVAYHESGHAIVALHTPAAQPIHEITIVPHGTSLGMVFQVAAQDNDCIGEKQIMASLDVCLGGIVAQELISGEQNVTSGSEHDLVTARDLAHKMVPKYRMSHGAEDSPSAEEKQKRINAEEVDKLLEESTERVRLLLKKHLEELEALVNALIKKETLTSDKVLEIVHQCQVYKEKQPQ